MKCCQKMGMFVEILALYNIITWKTSNLWMHYFMNDGEILSIAYFNPPGNFILCIFELACVNIGSDFKLKTWSDQHIQHHTSIRSYFNLHRSIILLFFIDFSIISLQINSFILSSALRKRAVKCSIHKCNLKYRLRLPLLFSELLQFSQNITILVLSLIGVLERYSGG